MSSTQQLDRWGQIVAKAWQDDAFKKRLLADPAAVLNAQGLETPAGLQIRVVENTDKVLYLTIPAKPREGELSDDDLEQVAGGFGGWTGALMTLQMYQPGGPLGDRCVRTTYKDGEVTVSCSTDPHMD